MVKRAKSIDGFTRRQSASTTVTTNGGNIPVNHRHGVRNQNMARVDADGLGQPERELMRDIEASLGQIDSPGKTDKILDNDATWRRHARANKSAKPKLNKKKLAKRIIIAVILAILAIVGYLGVKVLLAGGKVFKGNPLGMITSKERLAEDSNGRTNILIFGTSGYSMSEDAWDGAMLTDSIMVASVDQDKDDVYLMSLPRDLYVKNNCPVLSKQAGKLNEVFYCAYAKDKDEKAGAEALMSKAGEILGLKVQYYVHADWTALTQLVDAVGGVDVTIESSDPRGIYDSGTGIRYKNGEVAHLDGEKALALARARNHNYGDYGLAGGNYAREQNQQKILKALQQKALSAGTLSNPVKVNNMIDSLGNNLITDFSSGHVQTLIDVANKTKEGNIKQLPFVSRGDDLPDLFESYEVAGSYLGEKPVAGVYDYDDIQAYVAQNLTSDPIKRENATIDILNGSSAPGLASQKADELEDKYKIGEITNAPQESSVAVTIYKRNDDKPKTVEALEKKYNVKAISGELSGYATDADIIIVFGADDATE